MIVNSITDKGLYKEFCEDRTGHCGTVFWVIDGATVPTLYQEPVYTAGWLVNKLDEQLEKIFSAHPLIPLADVLAKAIDEIKQSMPGSEKEYSILPSATVAIIRITDEVIEYLVLGDCSVTISTDQQIFTITDNRLGLFAAGMRDRLVAKNQQHKGFAWKGAEEEVKELVLAERKFMNVQNGYWVVSLDKAAAKQATTGYLMATKFSVCLYTDGFARLINEYKVFNREVDMVDAVKKKGLESLIKILRKTELADKDCRVYPRVSFSDDAACIFLEK